MGANASTRRRLAHRPEAIHRSAWRDCPKSLGRPLQHSLTGHEKALFGPFWRSYTGQIYGRSVARTPFRTVSEDEFSEVQRSYAGETSHRSLPEDRISL